MSALGFGASWVFPHSGIDVIAFGVPSPGVRGWISTALETGGERHRFAGL
jgi:hypothetical protein